MKQKEDTPASGLHNTLGAGTNVKGDIITDTDFRLDGKVDGNVTCGGKLVIGPKAEVTGEITSVSAEILGTVIGTLRTNGLLLLKASAQIKGDIFTQALEIEPNACFNGICTMTSDNEKEKRPKQ